LTINGLRNKTENWGNKLTDDFTIEENLLNIPVMRNNSDICLFKSDTCLYKEGNIVDEQKNKKQKGGIDPAGADEH
jgi:hypothetical protein